MNEWITEEPQEVSKKYDEYLEKQELDEINSNSITASELIKLQLPEINFIVDNMLSSGIVLLAGAPKAGKSWLVLQLCIAVAKGSYFLEHRCNKADVIYFALEDSQRRLQNRLKQVLQGSIAPDNLELITTAPRIDEKLLDVLRGKICNNQDIGLIVIDTLFFIKPLNISKKDAYDQDYKILSDIGKLARQSNICILVVHHTRKSNGIVTDPFETILGSTALQGAVDSMAVLKRNIDVKNEAELHIRGRDIEPLELSIEFKNHCWENLGDLELKQQREKENEYNNHPAIITLKNKLKEIQQDDNEPIKEYITTMKGFRDDVIKVTGELVGTSERKFTEILKSYDSLLMKDNIKHIEPKSLTKYKNKAGRFHRYMYIKK